MATRQPELIDIPSAKRWLRETMVTRRQQVTLAEQRRASRQIVNRLVRSSYYREARVIAAFIGFGSEVLTHDFFIRAWKDQKQILVPMTDQGFDRPYFVLFRPGDEVMKTKRGPLEPISKGKAFDFSSIDLVLIPGLGFDADGYRLGYGGGVYDRILGKTKKAKHVGLFFTRQEVRRLPRDRHDRPMAAVVTEEKILPFTSARTATALR